MWRLVVGGAVGGVIAAWLSARAGNEELSKIFWAAVVTLIFGSLLSGVVTLLFADFDRRRAQRAAQLDFISNVLADLKSVNDRVDRARTLIRARKSAKTYGEEMLNLIDARVVLKNVRRALDTDDRSKVIQSVRDKAASMDDYLRSLLEEYEREYKGISLEQSVFEARLKAAVEKKATPEDPAALENAMRALENTPWRKIESLERMKDFLATSSHTGTEASAFMQEFTAPLNDASRMLRDAIAAQLSQSR